MISNIAQHDEFDLKLSSRPLRTKMRNINGTTTTTTTYLHLIFEILHFEISSLMNYFKLEVYMLQQAEKSTPTPWLTWIHFTQISVTQLFKRFLFFI